MECNYILEEEGYAPAQRKRIICLLFVVKHINRLSLFVVPVYSLSITFG